MSRFSESFKKLIQEKDINVYSMVQYCNTDRSTMYKYISGKRKLKDFTLFQKITEFIRLSPQEYRAFLEDYHINNIGEYAYYCRQNVEDFILAFPEKLSFFHRFHVINIDNPTCTDHGFIAQSIHGRLIRNRDIH